MNTRAPWAFGLALMLAGGPPIGAARAAGGPVPPHDGAHDFDFKPGIWRTHIRRLLHPLSGSNGWTELDGRVTARPVWDGRALLEEIDAKGPDGAFEGLTLFLYNPQAHQWSLNFSNSQGGQLGVPMIGGFEGARGAFYDQETFNGRTILARMIWTVTSPDSHAVEQAFSEDGGRTWEPNFVATLIRERK